MSGQQYDNELSGAIFKNDKQGNEKRPDYRGQCQVGRVEYWVSGWIREPKAGGAKFMSLRFEAKKAAAVKGGAENPAAQQSGPVDFDDDIPFMWLIAVPLAGMMLSLLTAPVMA